MIFAIPQKKKKNNYIDDMPLGKDQVTTNNNITNVNICIIIKWRRAKCFNDQFLPIARANYRQSAIKSSNNDLSLSHSFARPLTHRLTRALLFGERQLSETATIIRVKR